MNIKRYTPLEEFKLGELRKMVKIALEWCYNNLGKPVYGKIPEYKLTNMIRKNYYYGLYFRDPIYSHKSHKIILFIKSCETMIRLLSTIIHEYVHSTQKMINRDYDIYSYVYGSWDNPFEKEARRIENENKFKLLKHIQTIYNK